MDSVLMAVHTSSDKERARIQLQAVQDLQADREAVNTQREDAADATAFVRLKLDEMEKKNEVLNLKFLKCFGVFASEWDGTEAGALRLLAEKKAKLGK